MAPSFFERITGKKTEPEKPPQMVKVGIAEGPTVELPVTDPEKFSAMQIRQGVEEDELGEDRIIFTNIRRARPSELPREPKPPARGLEESLSEEPKGGDSVKREVSLEGEPAIQAEPIIPQSPQEAEITAPQEAASLHNRFHIEPTMGMAGEVLSTPVFPETPPTTVDEPPKEREVVDKSVSEGVESIPVQEVSTVEATHDTRVARSTLIQKLETPGITAAERKMLESQIRALNEGAAETEISSEEGVHSEILPESVIEEGKEDVCPEGEAQPVQSEESPEDISDKVGSSEAKKSDQVVLNAEEQLAKREAEARELAEKKERIGNKILGSIAKIEKLNRDIPKIEALIKKADSKNNPALGKTTKLSLQERRLAQTKSSITQEEDRLKQWKNDFLALGGTSEEIEALVVANSDEKPAEKPLVQPTPEIVELSQEMLGDKAVLGSMAAGLVMEEIEDQEGGQVETKEGDALVVEEIKIPEQIESLEQAISEARSAYVAEDVREMSTRNRLAVHFPWLKEKGALDENKDLIALRGTYQSLLKQYQEQELAKIRTTKTVEERNETLESLLKYFRFDEALRLENEYIVLQKENQGIGGKALNAYETMGRWYNGLSLKQKVALGGGAFVGAMALSAAGGIGLAVGAPGVVFARRLVAGAGGAVSLDAISEKWLEGRKAKEEKKILSEQVEESQDLSNEELALKMQLFLDDSIQSLDEEVDKRRKKTAVRKWTSRILGGGGGIILSNAFNGFFAEAPDTSVESGNPLISDGPVAAPEVAGNQDLSGTETPRMSAPTETNIESSRVSVETSLAGSFPEQYAVTAENSQAGLWGILDRSLPSNFPDADRAKAVASLQNLIANKLEHLSPEEQNALGFRGGNINTIYPGETLKLQSLVSQNELNEILEGKVVALEVVPEVPVEIPETGIGLEEVETPEAELPSESVPTETDGPEDLLEGVEIGGGFENLVVDETPTDNTRELLANGSLERTLYSEELGKMRQGIFVTPETSNWLRYSFILHPEMGEVPMGEVINGSESLPLHESQVERLKTMAEQAVASHGQGARPGKYETIMAYTRRIATLGFQEKTMAVNQ